MATEQAGTPEAATDGSVVDAGTPSAGTQDGSGLNAQQQQDFINMKVNRENDRKRIEAQDAEIRRLSDLAYGRGAQAATDPDAETYQALAQNSEFDPASRGAKRAWEEARVARLESELATNLTFIPEAKRKKVAEIVRATGFRANVEQALASLDDPETAAAHAEIVRLKAENERLKKQPSPAETQRSPAATIPADADAGAGEDKDMPRSDYVAILRGGGERANALMKAVANGKTKLTDG